jgi:hypothetical protein
MIFWIVFPVVMIVEVLLAKTDRSLEAPADVLAGDGSHDSGARLLCFNPRAPKRRPVRVSGLGHDGRPCLQSTDWPILCRRTVSVPPWEKGVDRRLPLGFGRQLGLRLLRHQ